MPAHVLRIDLRHHQRNVIYIAEIAGVIDDHSAGSHSVGCVELAGLSAGKKGDVDALEGSGSSGGNSIFLTAESDLFALGTFGSQQAQLPDGEITLGQDFHELVSYGAAGADDSNVILFHSMPPLFLYGDKNNT